MNKNKLSGLFNLIVGILSFLISIPFFFILPKVNILYMEINRPKPSMLTKYLFLAIILMMGAINIIYGIKLTFFKKEIDKTYRKGIILAIVTFLVSFILFGIISLLTIFPIYNLTSDF